MMQIFINLRQLGKKRGTVSPVPFTLEKVPGNLRQLIVEAVRTCVAAYNQRICQGDQAQPMTEDRLHELESIGKLAFDVNYNDREANEQQAIDTALQAFADGLYRVFQGDTELTALDAPLNVHENDTFTFVRLTMLTGLMW